MCSVESQWWVNLEEAKLHWSDIFFPKFARLIMSFDRVRHDKQSENEVLSSSCFCCHRCRVFTANDDATASGNSLFFFFFCSQVIWRGGRWSGSSWILGSSQLFGGWWFWKVWAIPIRRAQARTHLHAGLSRWDRDPRGNSSSWKNCFVGSNIRLHVS